VVLTMPKYSGYSGRAHKYHDRRRSARPVGRRELLDDIGDRAQPGALLVAGVERS
jgi:hypothetical protein